MKEQICVFKGNFNGDYYLIVYEFNNVGNDDDW